MKEDMNFAFGLLFEALIRIINITIFIETIVIIYERRITKKLMLLKLSQYTFGSPV